jgi:hypothetical protein
VIAHSFREALAALPEIPPKVKWHRYQVRDADEGEGDES